MRRNPNKHIRSPADDGHKGEAMYIQHKNNPHIEYSFDDVLSEEVILGCAVALEIKRIIAMKISEGMLSLKLNKTAMAKRMHVSRPLLNRLLR